MTDITVIGVVGDTQFRSARDADPAADVPEGQHQGPAGWSSATAATRRPSRGGRAEVEADRAPTCRSRPSSARTSSRELYKAEERGRKIFAAFSLLAVLIGCLGLFGLASFTAERRTKEIGIRKVLGARTRDIVRLLVWQFSRPVLVANLIAWPVAWWLMRDWLNGFEQRITLGPTPFLVAAVIALGIAIATVVGHAVRVARANPIHALRMSEDSPAPAAGLRGGSGISVE